METPKAWAVDVRRTRHISDCRDWKDRDSYQKALQRLLRDLKSIPTIAIDFVKKGL